MKKNFFVPAVLCLFVPHMVAAAPYNTSTDDDWAYVQRNKVYKQPRYSSSSNTDRTVQTEKSNTPQNKMDHSANAESPLYMPKQGTIYSKTSLGPTFVLSDDTPRNKTSWRAREELGVGILNALKLYGKIDYMRDDNTQKSGIQFALAGLNFRAIDTMSGWTLDLYADAHSNGFGAMRGSITSQGLIPDNCYDGSRGLHVGTQLGKTWSKFSVSAFVGVERNFSNDDYKIKLIQVDMRPGYNVMIRPKLDILGFPNEISVRLDDRTNYNLGFNIFYQNDNRWSFGSGFKFMHKQKSVILSVTPPPRAPSQQFLDGWPTAGMQINTENKILSYISNFGWYDTYTFSMAAAYKLTDIVQIGAYSECTFNIFRNNADVQAELGIRLNLTF